MPTFDVPEGETEELIGADQADRTYEIRIASGLVSFGHEKPNAPRNTVRRRGQAGTLRNLRGQPIYVHGHTEAQVEIERTGFFFDQFSSYTAASPSSTAGGEGATDTEQALGNYRAVSETISMAGGTLDTSTAFSKDDEEPEILESVSWSVVGDVDDVYAVYQMRAPDVDSNTVDFYEIVLGAGDGPMTEIEVPLPPTCEVFGTIKSFSGAGDGEIISSWNIRKKV